jgi:hypothetical protein
MKLKHLIYSLVLLSLVFTACDLDPQVENTFGDDSTWSFPDYAEGVLLNAYAAIPSRFNNYDSNFLDVATDNAVTNDYSSNIYEVATGGINPNFNPIGNWNSAYDQFRNIHLFLENGLGENVIYNISDEVADQQYRDRLKGEAYYLRAWWGFQLLQEFGGKTATGKALGYPIVTETLTGAELENVKDISRNTYEECVERIIADIDTAMVYLPQKYSGGSNITGTTGLGRADDQVALALKSRLLLYAASPAYQDDDITKLNGMGFFSVVDEEEYTRKWIASASAAQEALDLVGNVNGLDEGQFTDNNTPNEFIWRKYHNDRVLESDNFPPLDYGKGYTSPSQNLVNSFPAKNGYPIDSPEANYDPEAPYANRDPRLELNVLYNGENVLGDPLETFVGGRDSKEKNYSATRTGYYVRKWLALEDLLDPNNLSSQHHYYVLFRKTELLLNFAEASNEAFGPLGIGEGNSMSALEAMKMIRKNAGINNQDYITSVAESGTNEFRNLIQNERRIELSFENHRFFDMRRWLLPLDEDVNGVRITKTGADSFSFEEYKVEERPFHQLRDYYLPIPYDEQIKSDLINNLGW